MSFKYESVINPSIGLFLCHCKVCNPRVDSSGWPYDGLLLQRARHDGRIHMYIQDNKFNMWTNGCLASSYFTGFSHACTHCIGMPQLHGITYSQYHTLHYITNTSAQHCLHMLYSTAQLKQPWPLIITWYNELSQRIQSLYAIYCTRPSMQVCKRWMTMSIGFVVVPMLITSGWWLVSDLLELITPSDREGSFKSVIAVMQICTIFRRFCSLCYLHHCVAVGLCW